MMLSLMPAIPTLIPALGGPGANERAMMRGGYGYGIASGYGMAGYSVSGYSGSMAYGAPWASPSSILVQGGSRRTWSYRNAAVEKIQVVVTSDARPIDADIELWQGPDNTPIKMRVYVENGMMRPFSAVLETLSPSSTQPSSNTVSIKNTADQETPFEADVFIDGVDTPSPACIEALETIQGEDGVKTYPVDQETGSVEVLLKTDGRPLNARLELIEGPNNNKQVVELYTEDGLERPFFCILETGGDESSSTIRVVNTNPLEFPLQAGIVPFSVDERAAAANEEAAVRNGRGEFDYRASRSYNRRSTRTTNVRGPANYQAMYGAVQGSVASMTTNYPPM